MSVVRFAKIISIFVVSNGLTPADRHIFNESVFAFVFVRRCGSFQVQEDNEQHSLLV